MREHESAVMNVTRRRLNGSVDFGGLRGQMPKPVGRRYRQVGALHPRRDRSSTMGASFVKHLSHRPDPVDHFSPAGLAHSPFHRKTAMTMKPISLLIPLLGIVALLLGGMWRSQSHAELRAKAVEIQQSQREAAERFHGETKKATARYQAGEIDEATWRAENAAISQRFQESSESAGTAWVDAVTTADSRRNEGMMLNLAGICATIALVGGIAWGLRDRGRAG